MVLSSFYPIKNGKHEFNWYHHKYDSVLLLIRMWRLQTALQICIQMEPWKQASWTKRNKLISRGELISLMTCVRRTFRLAQIRIFSLEEKHYDILLNWYKIEKKNMPVLTLSYSVYLLTLKRNFFLISSSILVNKCSRICCGHPFFCGSLSKSRTSRGHLLVVPMTVLLLPYPKFYTHGLTLFWKR